MNRPSKYDSVQHIFDQLLEEGKNPTQIADIFLSQYSEQCTELKATHNGIRKRAEELRRKNKLTEQHPALAKECEDVGIPIENVKYGWHKSEHFSLFFKGEEVTAEEYYEQIGDRFEEIAERFVKIKDVHIPQKPLKKLRSIKVTLADMHVGLEPNPDDTGLYQYEYNREILFKNLEHVFNNLCNELSVHGRFDYLLFDDLGDGLDGYNKKTTRGGHTLEQNMGNVEAWDAYVDGKLWLIEKCINEGIANKYLIRNVTNDNHAGSFGMIANAAIEKILSRAYSQECVKVYNLKLFMEHFKYGVHTFIMTHGKDEKHMKHGLPLVLNDKASNFIRDYIDQKGINTPAIHVEKADLHQLSYQDAGKFDYRNYMSFAPPSNWVQTNFGSGYSGYSIQIIPKDSIHIDHKDYRLELVKKETANNGYEIE